MENFISSLLRVLVSLFFASIGFILFKAKKISDKHLSSLSTLLIYGFSPFMIIYSFYNLSVTANDLNISIKDIVLNLTIFGIFSIITQILFMLILFLILKNKLKESKYRMVISGSVLGNVGFFGLPLIETLLKGNNLAMCYSIIYVVTMNILVFTVGIYTLTNDSSYISIKKAILNPTMISFIIAIIVFIFGDKLNPNEYTNIFFEAFNLLGQMTTPICMIILGVRLASINIIKLFTRPIIYFISSLKLIIFPLFSFFLIYFIPGISSDIKAALLILSSVPCASVILNMAEIHHKEEELAASLVLVTTLLCIITIPIMTLLINIL